MLFRFRAEAAVTIRRKRDEDAQRVLADAQRAVAVAERALSDAQSALAAALARAQEDERQGADPHVLVWHRNWMKHHHREIAAHRQVIVVKTEAERQAKERALIARRELRALERLREKVWKRYVHAAGLEEQKQLDLHANLRFAARMTCQEER